MREHRNADAVGSGNWLEGRGAGRKPVASEAARMLAGVPCPWCENLRLWGYAYGCRRITCSEKQGTGQRSSGTERSGAANVEISNGGTPAN